MITNTLVISLIESCVFFVHRVVLRSRLLILRKEVQCGEQQS